jgi:hypothetical protein
MIMTRRRLTLFACLAVVAIAVGVAVAQPFRGRNRSAPGIIPDDRAGVPNWKVDDAFKNDVFTFVRVEYDSFGGGGGRRGGRGFGGGGGFRFGGGWGGGWDTDFPDSDLNFSFRLQQLTSLKVNPVPVTLRLTEERLFDYPFIYIIEPGNLSFSEEECRALNRYLLNGGFLMVDDFWGEDALQNFLFQMKRVFPEDKFEPAELPFEHEIFRCVYKLKEKPQVPSIHNWEGTGRTWENHGPNSETVHYLGISDDKGRLMAIICHNTDLGDGWEREGENEQYFHDFSEKKSYPMGINIVTYAMTH